MPGSRQFLDLMGQLYESALDDSQWSSAMDSLAKFVGAAGTFYFVADQQKARIVHSELHGVDPSANQLYLDYYGTRDPRLLPALRVPVGTHFTNDMLVDWREFKTSEIFSDLLTPYDIPHIFGTWVTKDRVTASAFILERSFDQGPFERLDVDRCSVIMPHVVRALRTREALSTARRHRRIYMDLVDRLPFGVALLDAQLQVLEASAVARDLFRDGRDISCRAGRLRAASLDDDQRLQRALTNALSRKDRNATGQSLQVRRPDASVSITIVPVANRDLFGDATPTILVMLVDRTSVSTPSAAKLATALGVTQAEAMLVCALFSGITLREAATSLGRSINTCKSQLKSIYNKTGCRNHGDLVKSTVMHGLATGYRDAPLAQ